MRDYWNNATLIAVLGIMIITVAALIWFGYVKGKML